MPVERRGWVIAFEIGSTGNGRNPIFNGRRQPSCGGTSRMTRECQVRFCEGLGVKFPGPTRPGSEVPDPAKLVCFSSSTRRWLLVADRRLRTISRYAARFGHQIKTDEV